MATVKSPFVDLLSSNENKVLDEWLKEQISNGTLRKDLMQQNELHKQSKEFLSLFNSALKVTFDIHSKEWDQVKDFLGNISYSRAMQGYTPSETASFIFSLKQPLINIFKDKAAEPGFFNQLWDITMLLDKLGLYTTEVFISRKEETISRQQLEMIELSTPVVQLWTGILALPLIGTLDSARTQVVMENLLTKIVETGSQIAIIDITGVPTVDTLVAQHLLKTVAAARLMGADCIISGIRPQIAQTIVHLGVNLEDVVTKATMADAFKLALSQNGYSLNKINNKVFTGRANGENTNS